MSDVVIPKCAECPAQAIGCKVSNGNLHNGGSACKIFHEKIKTSSTNKITNATCPDCGASLVVELHLKKHKG